METKLKLQELTIPQLDRLVSRTTLQPHTQNTLTDFLQLSDILHEEGDITICPADEYDTAIQIRNNFSDNSFTLEKVK